MSPFHKLKDLSAILKKISTVKNPIFLVVGKHVRADIKLSAELENIFKSNQIVWYSGIKSHPRIQDAKRIIKIRERIKPAVIIAIGGASIIDLAKVALGFKTVAAFTSFIKTGHISPVTSAVNLIAIPTTFGSGSESTPYAVIYGTNKKYSIEHSTLRPRYTISDARLGLTVPQSQIASAGFDCVAEAVEALWSTHSTRESDVFARRALRLALVALPRIFVHPTNINWQKKMAAASYAVGQAIAITHTTAPHAFSYPLSIKYHIPHGLACSLTLDTFLEYNHGVTDEDCLDLRGAALVRSHLNKIASLISGRADVFAAVRTLRNLKKKLKIPARLRDWGVRKADVPKLVSNGLNPERLLNNPRRVNLTDAARIYQNIY